MCIKKGCNSRTQMCHCCLLCQCNVSCYMCYNAEAFYVSGMPNYVFEHSNADVRKKFVCFPCKRVWKSSFSKYLAHKVLDKCEGYEKFLPTLNKVINNEPIPIYKDNSEQERTRRNNWILFCGTDKTIEKSSEANKNNPYTKSERRELNKFIREDYTSGYLADNSHCAKCGNPGKLVGRNFRPCKTDKEWKKLEDKYKDNVKGLFTDFYDYPREGTEESAAKFELKRMTKSINKEKLYNC